MIIGTNTRRLMQVYALTNTEVAFAQLVAAGRTNAEAYDIAFTNERTTTASAATAANQLLNNRRPNLQNLINALKASINPDATSTPGRHEVNNPGTGYKKLASGNIPGAGARADGNILEKNPTTKDGQLQLLTDLFNRTNSVKEQADILKQISDLQQMKKAETTAEEERIHLYLPVTCDICPYKPADNVT